MLTVVIFCLNHIFFFHSEKHSLLIKGCKKWHHSQTNTEITMSHQTQHASNVKQSSCIFFLQVICQGVMRKGSICIFIQQHLEPICFHHSICIRAFIVIIWTEMCVS